MDGLITLSDGRSMSYGEFGTPDAPPLFYCHGYPTSRIEYEIIARQVETSGAEVRVVVLDRPGYGASTFQPARRLLDWPRDVAEVADRLGIGEFSVLGASGGGPYALACAVAMPDRVTRFGLVVAAGPAAAPGMEQSLIFRTVPRATALRRLQFEMMSMGLGRGREDRIFDSMLASIGGLDREFLQQAVNRDWFLRVTRESFTQGGRAAAHDGGIYLHSWGFDVGSVNAETHLWYCGRDDTIPATVGVWLADQISGASLALWPQHGHFTWMASPAAAEAIAVTSGVR